jgi:acetylornithine deacetylase/succinyl-diaminopimelate desuccinylase-like protein
VDLTPIFEHLDASAIARDVLEFVRVPSETGADERGTRYLADLFRRNGFSAEVDEISPGMANVYSLIEGAAPGAPALLINGHTDTIPIGDSDPPAIDGDWVIGRGTEDMKGGLVAMVHAAAALRKAGVRLAGNLWLSGVADHEAPEGKKRGPRRLIEHLRSGRIAVDGIVIVEGPAAIWSASLGSTIFTVTIESRRGRIHTVKVPYFENPALYAGRLLVELEKLERAFAQEPPHPLCGHERINIGIVAAGDYFNRLPTPAVVTGTWRWTPGKTHSDVEAQLSEICRTLSTEMALEHSLLFEGTREPFETPRDHPLMQALLAGGSAAMPQPPEVIGMALVGDANLYANEAGVPVAYYGPAHETAHSDHERVSISSLMNCARLYAATAIQFCGVAS